MRNFVLLAGLLFTICAPRISHAKIQFTCRGLLISTALVAVTLTYTQYVPPAEREEAAIDRYFDFDNTDLKLLDPSVRENVLNNFGQYLISREADKAYRALVIYTKLPEYRHLAEGIDLRSWRQFHQAIGYQVPDEEGWYRPPGPDSSRWIFVRRRAVIKEAIGKISEGIVTRDPDSLLGVEIRREFLRGAGLTLEPDNFINVLDGFDRHNNPRPAMP